MNKTLPPRDRLFMADCGWPWLMPCFYNEKGDDFVVSVLHIDADGEPYFENEWFQESDIKGWIELPDRD